MDPIERQLDHMRRVALPEKLRELVGIGDAVTFSLNLEPLEIYILPLNTPIPHSKLTKRIDGLGRVAIPKEVCLIGNLGEYDTVTLRAADDNSHIILTQKEIDHRRNAAEWLAAALYYFLKTPIIVAAEYGTIGYCGPIECKVQCYMRDYFMAVKEWIISGRGEPADGNDCEPLVFDVYADAQDEYFYGYRVALIKDENGSLIGAVLSADDGTIQEYPDDTANTVLGLGAEIMKLWLHNKEMTLRYDGKELKDMGTAIIRKVDDLGRIVLPKEARKRVGVEESDPMKITWDDRTIYLNPVEGFGLPRVAQEYADNLSAVLELPVAIVGQKETLAYAGPDTYLDHAEKNDFYPLVRQWLEKKDEEAPGLQIIMSATNEALSEPPIDCYHVAPLKNTEGELFGAVLVMDDRSNRSLGKDAYIAAIRVTAMRLLQELGC